MTPSERVAFALSEEGKNFLFPFGLTIDGKRYEKMVPGSVARAFYAATTFAQNCGGGGSAPDQNWGCDKNEDDILWTRRCFRKAREMITTPVIRWGRRR